MNVRQIKWGRIILWLLAIVGGLTLFVHFVMPLVRVALFEITRMDEIVSPDGELKAYREVTRGGFGTVWTTRIYVTDRNEGQSRIVYSNKDSDFIPKLQWVSAEQLSISLPCGRIDHVGNPKAYSQGKVAFARLQVRFANTNEECVKWKEE
ncbi:MAG: hypothetical protein AAGE37_06105 [Pseudomonadota bacterium]